ncbi:hypothetical protein ACSS6W_003260 [Trichoderma asperelloides]
MRDRALSLAGCQAQSLHEECGVAPIVLKKRGELCSSAWDSTAMAPAVCSWN